MYDISVCMIVNIQCHLRFPAHAELGTSRTRLVSLEQSLLCISVRPVSTNVLTVT